MLVYTTDVLGGLHACPEWPMAWLKFRSCAGVIGPEVEANHLTRELEKYGVFDRLLCKSKEETTKWLLDSFYPADTIVVWINRYYL